MRRMMRAGLAVLLVASALTSVSHAHGLDIRGLGSVLTDGARRFLPGDPAAGYESAGTWVNGLAERQGSLLGYADAGGLVGSLVYYDPYGAPLPGSPSPDGPGYTGQWTDASGLVDLRARPYDPTLAAFLSRDAFGGLAGLPASANRHAYALGNPLRFTDPSGRFVAEFLRHPGLYSSILLQSIPGLGDGLGLLIGAIGYDVIAGVALSPAERALAMGLALGPGGGFHLLARLGHGPGDEIADLAGRSLGRSGGRSADELGDLGRVERSHLAPTGQSLARRDGVRHELARHPFESGASAITTSRTLRRHAASPLLSSPHGMFVTPRVEMDSLLANASSRREIEIALGLRRGQLEGSSLVRIYIPDPFSRSLRLPDPSLGNEFHRPGSGITWGGLHEGVIDAPSRDDPLIEVLELAGL